MACPECGNEFNGVRTYFDPDRGMIDQWRCGKCRHKWEEVSMPA